MPTYEFECEQCHKHFMFSESFSEHDKHEQHKCPKCGSKKVHQLIASVHVKTSKKS